MLERLVPPERTQLLDPVDHAVISQGMIAAAREMGVKLIRSAYSTIIREAADASAALFDRDGNVVAQAELIPMQLGPMSEIFRSCAAVSPVEDVQDGDFYITNDPYSGGQHLQDVFIYSPIFVDGELVAFAGTVAHHLDLGGGNPGLTTEAVDVHAEGLNHSADPLQLRAGLGGQGPAAPAGRGQHPGAGSDDRGFRRPVRGKRRRR